MDGDHQTVGWLKEQLAQYPDNLPVHFYTTSGGERQFLLSDYLTDDEKALALDIGV